MKVHNLLVTGSLTSGGENISTISSSVSTTVTELSSSLNSRLDGIQTSTGSLNTFTSSANNRLNSVETSTGSLNTFTSSANNRLNSIESVTGSYATTGSNTFNGNLTVTGFIDAQELRTTYISSSILYRSGSTKFGDELTDTHAFTGSMLLSGSLTVNGTSTIQNTLTLNGSNNVIRSGNELRFNRADNAVYTRLYDAGSLAANGFILDNINGEGFHFQNNGTTIMRMNSSGNVGIGSNSPVKTLEVRGTFAISNSAASYWYMDRDDSDGRFKILTDADAERFSITTSGNVGIGTTSPSSRLNVAGAKTNSSDLTTVSNQLAVTDTTATAAGVGGRISFLGAYTATPDYISFGTIEVLKDNANNYGSAGWNNAAMRFIVGNNDNDANAGRMLERMRITTDGEVLIGSTGNNLGKLDVTVSPSSYTAGLGLGFLTNSGEGNSVGISFKTKVSLGAGIYENARIAAITESVTSSVYGSLAFYTMNATTLTERMRIRNDGNVGIGTDSPSQQLSVKKVDNLTTAIASFAANNLSQQVDIWYAGVRAGGTSTNVDLYLSSKNAGNVVCETNGIERMRITSTGAIVHEGLNVRKTKSGGTSVTFTINLAATGYWAPGYATVRVAGTRGGLQEHYAAVYFVKITYYQGSTTATTHNIGGDCRFFIWRHNAR